MIEVFVIELMNLLKDKCSHREEPKVKEEKKYKKPHEEFLEQIEAEIDRLDGLKKHICFHQDNLRMLHKVVSDMMRKMTEDEPVTKKEPEKSEPETPHQPEEEAAPETEDEQLDTNVQTEMPNLTENERLEMLERGLRYAVDVLANTKMAQRFNVLKQLFNALSELAGIDDMPDVQRSKTIEAELRNAVDVLTESACAARTKVTIDLREHLIELLDKVKV